MIYNDLGLASDKITSITADQQPTAGALVTYTITTASGGSFQFQVQNGVNGTNKNVYKRDFDTFAAFDTFMQQYAKNVIAVFYVDGASSTSAPLVHSVSFFINQDTNVYEFGYYTASGTFVALSSANVTSAKLVRVYAFDESDPTGDMDTELDINSLNPVTNRAITGSLGKPDGVFDTLSDLTTAYPSGNSGVYVVMADNKWYTWSGSAWTAGGDYLSSLPDNFLSYNSENSITNKDVTRNIVVPYSETNVSFVQGGLSATGEPDYQTTRIRTPFMNAFLKSLTITANAGYSFRICSYYSNKVFIQYPSGWITSYDFETDSDGIVSSNAGYIIIVVRKDDNTNIAPADGGSAIVVSNYSFYKEIKDLLNLNEQFFGKNLLKKGAWQIDQTGQWRAFQSIKVLPSSHNVLYFCIDNTFPFLTYLVQYRQKIDGGQFTAYYNLPLDSDGNHYIPIDGTKTNYVDLLISKGAGSGLVWTEDEINTKRIAYLGFNKNELAEEINFKDVDYDESYAGNPSDFEVAGLSAEGQREYSTTRIVSKVYIPYCFDFAYIEMPSGYSCRACFYDKNKNFITYPTWQRKFVIPDQMKNASYNACSNSFYMLIVARKDDNSNIDTSLASSIKIVRRRLRPVIKDLEGRMESVESEVDDLKEGVAAVPSYWKTYLENKSLAIATAMAAVGRNGDAFYFITDIHYPEYSFGNSPVLAKYLVEHTPVKNIILGGDIIQTTAGEISEYRTINNVLDFTDRVNAVRGNHDSLDKNLFYSAFDAKVENYLNTEHHLYYVRDNDSQKIRYIFMDGYNPDSGSFTADDINWMKARITELQSGWFALVITHGMWIANTADQPTLSTAADYSLIKNALDDIYDTANATIIGVVCGHCHRNYQETTAKGYVIVASTCDANGYMATLDPVAPTRTAGTTTEQAFDLYIIDRTTRKLKTIRIGAGDTTEDRELTF